MSASTLGPWGEGEEAGRVGCSLLGIALFAALFALLTCGLPAWAQAAEVQGPPAPPGASGGEPPPSVATETGFAGRVRAAASTARALGLGAILRTDYYSASKELDGRHNLLGLTLQPKIESKLGRYVEGKVEGRLQDQDVTQPGGQRNRLLEGYATLHVGGADLRLGQQIIAWGRADAWNPTDLLTPKDYTQLSARDEVDRRFGLPAAQAAVPLSSTLTVSAVWIPQFQSSVIPLPQQTPFRIVPQTPSAEWRNHSWALKLDRSGTGIDWSVSFFKGFDTIPFGQVADPTTVLLRNQRIWAVGADAATTLGPYGLRAETAYVQTDARTGLDPEKRRPYWFTVGGVDRDVTEHLNVSAGAYLKTILDYLDPFQVPDPLVRQVAILNATTGLQLDRWETGLIGRLRGAWLQETLEGELLGVFNTNRTDFFLRPMLGYALSDTWKAYAGVDWFSGRPDSLFGRIRNTSAVFIELRATF